MFQFSLLLKIHPIGCVFLLIQSEAGDITGPYYENLEFHRVSIRVPTTTTTTTTAARNDVKNDLSVSNVVLRRHKNRQVDKKTGLFVRTPATTTTTRLSDGVVVVDTDFVEKTSFPRPTSVNVVDGRKFVKFGYSQHEVWNWLHREDVNANNNAICVEKVIQTRKAFKMACFPIPCTSNFWKSCPECTNGSPILAHTAQLRSIFSI